MADEITKAPLDRDSLREIWTSFGALVRSYVSAAEMHRPEPHARIEQRIEQGDEGSLALHDNSKALTLEADLRTGKGRWTIKDEQSGHTSEHGTFLIDSESRIEWNGKPAKLEIDAAAELVAELLFEASRDEDTSEATADAAGEAGGGE